MTEGRSWEPRKDGAGTALPWNVKERTGNPRGRDRNGGTRKREENRTRRDVLFSNSVVLRGDAAHSTSIATVEHLAQIEISFSVLSQ